MLRLRMKLKRYKLLNLKLNGTDKWNVVLRKKNKKYYEKTKKYSEPKEE